MGRAARECTERQNGRSPSNGELLPWRGYGLRVDVAVVDPGFETAADLFAGREERLVMRAARRQLDDPDGLVTIAVTARVGGRLVEGPQAITAPPKPCHTRTPTTSRAPWEPGPQAGFRTLQTKPRSAPWLARPWAPVATRRDEVAVGGLGLLDGRWAVSEEVPLVRAHLEQP
jgi:hypothetical protein